MQGRPSGELVEGPYDDTRPADAAARRPLLEALVQAVRYTCRHQWYQQRRSTLPLLQAVCWGVFDEHGGPPVNALDTSG